jgi:hypothetical protein
MRTPARLAVTVSATALLFAAVVGALAPPVAAAPLPLPLPAAESLITEGVTIEGPLINNVSLPMLR